MTSKKQEAGRTPETRAVHGGEPRERPSDALAEPIVQTATYTFASTQALVDYMAGKAEREEYGRYGNPTVRAAGRGIIGEGKRQLLVAAPLFLCRFAHSPSRECSRACGGSCQGSAGARP